MTQTFRSLADAIALAEFAHRNQLDKAGLPYIDHPRRVLAKVQAQGALPFVQIAAILHDVVEDTPFTCRILLDLGFSEAAVEVIDLMTRKAEVPDEEYYERIRQNSGALMLKLADISDNTEPWRLSYLPEPTQVRLRSKYEKALVCLLPPAHLLDQWNGMDH